MKKSFRKIFAAMLTVCILMSALAVTANAEAESLYKTYTVLGDSNASGYGTKGYDKLVDHDHPVKDGVYVEGTYGARVGEAMGAETVNFDGHSGWRTDEFLRAVNYPGFTYDTDPYSKYCGSDFLYRALNWVSWKEMEGVGEKITNDIKDADLITVNFGANDMWTFAFTATVNRYGDIFNCLDFGSPEELSASFSKMLAMADEREAKGIITDFVTACENGFKRYKENIPKIIDYIRSVNEDAQIVVLSVDNPVFLTLDLIKDNNIRLDLYSVSDLLAQRVNTYLKNECSAKDEYLYVDVVGAEYFGLAVLDWEKLITNDPDLQYSAIKMLHPSDNGHAYIANKIINALKANLVTPTVKASRTSVLKNVKLRWDKVDGAIGYRVYRSTSPNTGFKLLLATPLTSHVDLLALPGVTYYYKVVAVMDIFGQVKTSAGVSDGISAAGILSGFKVFAS